MSRFTSPDELIGQKFGRLVVVSLDHSSKNSHWRCLCECGKLKTISRPNLTSGHTQSCGCYTHAKRGMYGTPEYHAWSGMIQRCHNTKSLAYPNYGGRGIRVCEQWLEFIAFIEDMGKRPSPSHSLERVNNQLGYSPDNCIWATKHVQVRNQRRSILITAFGRTQCRKDWARELGISFQCIKHRMEKLGLTAEQALTSTPIRRGKA